MSNNVKAGAEQQKPCLPISRFKVGNRVVICEVPRKNLSHWIGKEGQITEITENNLLSVQVGEKEKKVLTLVPDWVKPAGRSDSFSSVVKDSTYDEAIALAQSPYEPSVVMDSAIAPVAVDVLEPLTPEEEADRHRLELKVERAFYEAGSSLRELRDRRLYRDTHKTFEQYCRERFGFQRAHSYRLIDAAGVFENLASIEMSPNRRQILPTKLEQIRSLTSLESDKQREVWLEAVERANGKVPTGATVKGIVERVKQQDNTPTQPEYSQGDVVEIRSGGTSSLRKYDGLWGIITHVGSWSYQVHISLRGVNIQCKGMELERVDEKYTADIRAVSDRIIALCMRDDLATTALAVLEALARKTCFTPDDIWFLERVEERYTAKNSAK